MSENGDFPSALYSSLLHALSPHLLAEEPSLLSNLMRLERFYIKKSLFACKYDEGNHICAFANKKKNTLTDWATLVVIFLWCML